MQYAVPSCQLPHARTGDSRLISPLPGGTQGHADGTQGLTAAPVVGAGQEVEHTASRRTGPRRWTRVVTWLIGAGLHAGANATTQRVADDLAQRMDYTTGHVRYCLDEMVARLGISRATIKRHVAVLRELGALAWAVHGTRTNIRRALGIAGYAGTATVYAATIPPAYDRAMGHRVIGTGYTARAIATRPSNPVDNQPVDNPGSETREPPSLCLVEEEGKQKVVGGSNYTSRKRATCPTESTSPTRNSSNSRAVKGSTGRSPLRVARDIQTARYVRARVNWTQREGLRRLAFALRPLIDQGWDADQITAELAGMCLTWRPTAPAAFLSAEIARRAQNTALHEAALAAYELENCAEGAFTARPEQIADIQALVDEGLRRYRANAAAAGWDDDYTDEADAQADFASWLGGTR